jgi:hypothetical protein
VYWAEETKINNEVAYNNFGYAINFYAANNQNYLNALRGLWYAYWSGPKPDNIKVALALILGLPVVMSAGLVTEVSQFVIQVGDPRDAKSYRYPEVDPLEIYVEAGDVVKATQNITLSVKTEIAGVVLSVSDGLILIIPEGSGTQYIIPDGLISVVAVGQTVSKWDLLVNGVVVYDKVNDPDFIYRLDPVTLEQFYTQNVTAADKLKAPQLLKEHLFLPQVLAEAINTDNKDNVRLIDSFLIQIRPKYTFYILSIIKKLTESFSVTEVDENIIRNINLQLTMTVYNNEVNAHAIDEDDVDIYDVNHCVGTEVITFNDVLSITIGSEYE